MKHKLLVPLVLSAVHFAASVGALLWVYRVSSDAFDGRTITWFSRHLAGPLADILWFPLALLIRWIVLPGAWGYVPMIANSLLWGTALTLLWQGIHRVAKPQAESTWGRS
jgi:hypothetical protein